MWNRLFYHWVSSLGGLIGAAAAGAAVNVMNQGPTKEAAIYGAIIGAASGIVGAAGGAAKDGDKPPKIVVQ